MPNLCSDSRTGIQHSSSNRFSTHPPESDQSDQLQDFVEEEAVVMAHELEHLNLDPYVSKDVLATLKKHLVQGMQNYKSRLRSSCPESTHLNQSKPVSCRARSSSSASLPPYYPSSGPSNNIRHSKSSFQSVMSPHSCSPDSCLPFPIIPPTCSPSPNTSYASPPNVNPKRYYEPSPDHLSRSHTPDCRLNPDFYNVTSQETSGYPVIRCQIDEGQCSQPGNRYDNDVRPQGKELVDGRGTLSPGPSQLQGSESFDLDCSKITKVYLLKECSPVENSPCCQLVLQSSPQQANSAVVRGGFLRLVAMFRGKLIRDLFITEKVIDIIRMIKDTAEVLLSFCSDKNCNLEKEEEQFACRLQLQLQTSLSRLHQLFIETTPGERLAALRGSHNWRVANNFGQPRQRSPPISTLACATSLPTVRPPLYNPSPRITSLLVSVSSPSCSFTDFVEQVKALYLGDLRICALGIKQGSPSPAPQQRQRPQDGQKTASDAPADVLRFCDDWYQVNRLCALANLQLNPRSVPTKIPPSHSLRTACSMCQHRIQPPPCLLSEKEQAGSTRSQRQSEQRGSSIERSQRSAMEQRQCQSDQSRCSAERFKSSMKENQCTLEQKQATLHPLRSKQCQMEQPQPLGRSSSSGERKQRQSCPNQCQLDRLPHSALPQSMVELEDAPMCQDSWEEESEDALRQEEMEDSPRPLVHLWQEGSERSLDSSEPSNAAITPCNGLQDVELRHSQNLASEGPISAVVTIPGYLSVNLHRWPSRHSLHIYMPDYGTSHAKQNDAPQETEECQAIIQNPDPCVEETSNCCETRTAMTTPDALEKKKVQISCCGTPRSESSNTNNTICPGVPHLNKEEEVESGVKIGVNLRLQMYRMVNQMREEKQLLRGRVIAFRHIELQWRSIILPNTADVCAVTCKWVDVGEREEPLKMPLMLTAKTTMRLTDLKDTDS
ncbi:unnamed protein product [Hydatigera taeniaeformis]|uniref:Protein kinase domain-containing protein n=1 Tax=Hydatigena taeniaeformis TaxID=6205 RepID=A0A158REF5_HYDTA|nr:unnamed protein product [Hydatigera taeniaeformis]